MGTEGVEEVGHSYRKAAAGIVVIGGSLAALGAGLTYGLRHRPKVLLDRTGKVFGKVLNPVLLWVRDRFGADWPVLYHTGRKSGRE